MVTVRVDVKPELLDFARDRSGIAARDWERRFPKFGEWYSGTRQPTLKQLEDFARKTHTPVGLFFLPEPPVEEVPIADFRTVTNQAVQPDANLLDVIYAAQARQEWYRDHLLLNNESPVAWVGALSVSDSTEAAAAYLSEQLRWGAAERAACRTWSAALTSIREAAEESGVLVMIAGHAGSYTGRKLEPAIFRGFALSDDYAPVVFVNGADAKSAQIFTLVHELAHLLIGSTGLSDIEPATDDETERWCNRVAADFLLPADEFNALVGAALDPAGQLEELAEHFKVSTQTVLGRFRELGYIDWDTYWKLRGAEAARIAALPENASSGGNYLNTRPVQVSKRFASELLASAYEGTTSFTEALRLIGTKKERTLRDMADRLGVL